MPETATEDKKTASEAPKVDPPANEPQSKPEEAKKNAADAADAAADRILNSETIASAVPDSKATAVTEPVAADDGWKTLQEAATRNGITPEQMVRYASAGYQAQQATPAKPTPDPKPKQVAPEPEGDDDDLAPLSRKEFQSQMADMKQQTAVAIAGAKNDAKLEGLLNTQALTRDEPEARANVARSTYELMASGVNMETAFGEASRRFGNFLARVGKRSTTKKIAAHAALGEGGVGASAPIEPPTFKPDADNIRSGETLKRALAYSKELHGSG